VHHIYTTVQDNSHECADSSTCPSLLDEYFIRRFGSDDDRPVVDLCTIVTTVILSTAVVDVDHTLQVCAGCLKNSGKSGVQPRLNL
jgi:hypothetical protein